MPMKEEFGQIKETGQVERDAADWWGVVGKAANSRKMQILSCVMEGLESSETKVSKT